jgi:hypothetical protein
MDFGVVHTRQRQHPSLLLFVDGQCVLLVRARAYRMFLAVL